MLTLQIQRTNKYFLTQAPFSLFIDSRASVDSGALCWRGGSARRKQGNFPAGFCFHTKNKKLHMPVLPAPAHPSTMSNCCYSETMGNKKQCAGANELVRKCVGLQEGFCRRAGTWFPAIPINCLNKLQHLYLCSTAPAVSLITYSIIYVLWNTPLQGLPLRALKTKSISLAFDFSPPI